MSTLTIRGGCAQPTAADRGNQSLTSRDKRQERDPACAPMHTPSVLIQPNQPSRSLLPACLHAPETTDRNGGERYSRWGGGGCIVSVQHCYPRRVWPLLDGPSNPETTDCPPKLGAHFASPCLIRIVNWYTFEAAGYYFVMAHIKLSCGCSSYSWVRLITLCTTITCTFITVCPDNLWKIRVLWLSRLRLLPLLLLDLPSHSAWPTLSHNVMWVRISHMKARNKGSTRQVTSLNNGTSIVKAILDSVVD